MSDEALSRRSLLGGLAVAAIAGVAGFVIAKNSNLAHPKSGPGGTGGSGGGYGAGHASGGIPSSGGGGTGGDGGGTLLAQISQVPPSGGIVLAQQKIVLTRDADGTVHGFSAVCTHLGCTVGSVQNGLVICPCHGSQFNARTGSVVQGPATRALTGVPVVVRGSGIYSG